MLTLGQAARLAGVGKTTLTRAIRSGRLSATRRDDGGYTIDPSELARVYNVTPETVSATVETVRRATPGDSSSDPVLEVRLALAEAEAELKAMKDMLDEVRQSRDAWQAQAERLALAPPLPPSPLMSPVPAPAHPWWRRLAG
jgi:excisionase family DNA binding protein